jgi:hypothetical protein
VRKSTFDTFLKAVYDVVLDWCGQEYELNSHISWQVAKHVQDLIEKQLLGGLNIIVYVFKDKEDCLVRVLLEVSLDWVNHLNGVKLSFSVGRVKGSFES